MRALFLLSTNAADLSSLNKRRVRATNIAWPLALTTLAAPEKRTEPPFVVHWPTIYRHFEASCGPDVQRFAVPGPVVAQLLSRSSLPRAELSRVWLLADRDRDRSLCLEEFALAVWLVTERLSNPFFELPLTLSDQFLLDVLDADTLGAADDAVLASIAPRYAWMGEPIRPSTTRAAKKAVVANAAPSAAATVTPAAPVVAVPATATTTTVTADASSDHSEHESSHHSEDSTRLLDVHRAPSTEERARAKELVDLIDSVPPELRLDGPDHRFIMQGKLSKQNPSGVWQTRQYLLFDDVLVWTKPNLIGKRSVFKGAIGIVGGELRQTPVGETLDTRLCFTVRGGMGAIAGIVDKGKVYALKAATPGEKMTWVNAVRPLVAPPMRHAAEHQPPPPQPPQPSQASQPPPPTATPPVQPTEQQSSDVQPTTDEPLSSSMRGSSSRRLVRPKSALIREAIDVDEGTFASAVAVSKPPPVTGPSLASIDGTRPPPLFIGGLMGFNNSVDTDSDPSNSNSPLPSKREEELPSPNSKPPPPAGPPPKHVIEATAKQHAVAAASAAATTSTSRTATPQDSSKRRRHKHKSHSKDEPATPSTPTNPASLEPATSSRRKKSRSSKREQSTPAQVEVLTPTPVVVPPPGPAPPKPSPPPTVRPLESEHDAGPPPPPSDSTFKIALRKSGTRAEVSDLVAPPQLPANAHTLDADGNQEEKEDEEDSDEEVEEVEDEHDDDDDGDDGGDDDVSEEVFESEDESDDDVDAAAGNSHAQSSAQAVWSSLSEGGDKHVSLDTAQIEHMLSPPPVAPLAIEATTVDEWQAKMQAQVAAKRAARAAGTAAYVAAPAVEPVTSAAPAVPPAPPSPPAEPPAPPPRTDEATVLFLEGEWSAARDAANEAMRAGTAVVESAQLHTAARLMAAAVRLEVAASAGKSQALKSKAARKAARLVRLARSLVAPLSSAAADVCDAKLGNRTDDAESESDRWCFETFEPIEVDEACLQCGRCASVFSATSTDDRLAPASSCVVCGSGVLAIVEGEEDDNESE